MNQNFKKVLTATVLLPILFFANCSKDDPTPSMPSVESSVPTNTAEGVDVNAIIAFLFNEEMAVSTINTLSITLKTGTQAIKGSVDYSNKMARFTPNDPLDFSTLYTGKVSAEVTNTDGVALASDYVMTFTTGAIVDDTAPLISRTEPLNNEPGVARNRTVSIVFNESMDPSTINANTFMVKQGGTIQPGVIGYSGTTATFTGNEYFEANTSYNALITTGAKDMAGNALTENASWNFITGGSHTVLSPVNLGDAGNYVILAKTAISNISTSAIKGDLGLSPAATSYITGLALVDFTGYATSAQVTGNVYAADMASPTPVTLTTAVNDMITAYNDAAGRPIPDFMELGNGNIGGMTLEAGLYKWTNTVTVSADVTLTGGANDVWIFQIAGDLKQSASVNFKLTGGAQAKNIFWQIAGEATFGTTSHFEGNILSMTGITFLTGASMNGSALAQTAVILDANSISKVQ